MSALTGEWSVEKIRAVMVHLDRKTGLHGAELPIEMGKAVSYLGRYYCGERKSFYFSTHHLNDPAFPRIGGDRADPPRIRALLCGRGRLRAVLSGRKSTPPRPSWQYACKMVGASGRRVFGQDLLPELTAAELVRRFRAEDVRAFDMCGYIRMWNRLRPNRSSLRAGWPPSSETITATGCSIPATRCSSRSEASAGCSRWSRYPRGSCCTSALKAAWRRRCTRAMCARSWTASSKRWTCVESGASDVGNGPFSCQTARGAL